MSAPVKRTILSFSRDLEFATETELAKRMGCSKHYWLRAALKEALDNSLDACEEAGIAPEVATAIDGSTIAVADNGPGMSPELVERLCVRSERTSTREAFAAPDRGAQGNALQVLMALPFGFGRDAAVTTITSQAVEHTITLRVNRLEGCIDVERTEHTVPATPGTVVTMPWPASIDLDEVSALVYQHALLNQHAEFRLYDPAGNEWCSGETVPVTKWTPGLPTPAHWYTAERFEHRVLLEIRRDPKITVAQFLGDFKGLTSRTVRSEVAAVAGLSYQPLAALLDASGTALDSGRTRLLLAAMQTASRPPKPAVLGAVGKTTFETWARNHGSSGCGEPELLAYTTIDGVVSEEIPVRWEIGLCHLPKATRRQLLAGQNFSPAILPEKMADGVLTYAGRHFGVDRPIGLFLHRITPARQTLDYGKSNLGIEWSEAREVCNALKKIGKAWIKRITALDRGKRPPPEPKDERVTFQDAAFSAMADAYAAASSNGAYPVLSQQVFYKARPTILELTGKDELEKGERSRFCYVLLPQFMQSNPETTRSWRVLYKPRGELIEPHTRRRIGLGTSEVAAYRAGWTNGAGLGNRAHEIADWKPETCGPCHRYGAVVAVEKGGIADVLRQLHVDDRHDVAVIGNEGQSVEAELALVDAFGTAGVPIFLLTDFDRQGFTIAENLRKGTWRHRYANRVQVIHVGLRLEQINDLGDLEGEPIGDKARKHVSDDRLRECGATEEEIAFLRRRRVELNELSTEQLVGLVETALADQDIKKMIPDAEGLAAAWRGAMAHREIAEAVKEANKRAERWQNESPPDDLADRVRDLLEKRPMLSWDDAVRRIAGAGE